jgi:hypothetical protein
MSLLQLDETDILCFCSFILKTSNLCNKMYHLIAFARASPLGGPNWRH